MEVAAKRKQNIADAFDQAVDLTYIFKSVS
jgi:hypothetical protein